MLSLENPESPKGKVYKKYLKGRELVNAAATVRAAMTEVIEDPKTLMYGHIGVIQRFSTIEEELRNQLFGLKIADGSWLITTNALQGNSEFLQIFNHYILRQFEHGLLTRNRRKKWLFRSEQFGISEAYPMSLSNVIFPFIWILVGILAALSIALMEACKPRMKRKAQHMMPTSGESTSSQLSPANLSRKLSYFKKSECTN